MGITDHKKTSIHIPSTDETTFKTFRGQVNGEQCRETANKRPFLRYDRNEHGANAEGTNLAKLAIETKKRDNLNFLSTLFKMLRYKSLTKSIKVYENASMSFFAKTEPFIEY